MTASPNERMEWSHCEKNEQMMMKKNIEMDLPGTVVSHGAAGVAAVKDPAEVLGELVRRVDDTGQVAHDNVALLAPFLDSEVLYIDMTGTFGRAGGVDHIDGCLVIFMKNGGAGLSKAKFVEDSAKILGDFGGIELIPPRSDRG